MSRIADADVRARAIDPADSFIVQAPAGSGKTELLTRRVLRLLAVATEPEEIVAITFTKKAAAEMRARVHDAIRLAASGEPARDEHVAETLDLARAALARSREKGWALESSPQRLRVQTIDALCASIVQQSPLLSGAGGAANVIEDAAVLYRDAARATLALIDEPKLSGPVQRALQHYDNQVFTLEEQLVGLLGKRDQWLKLLEGQSGEAQREAMEGVLRDEIAEALQPLKRIPPPLLRQWRELAIKSMPTLPRLLPADAEHLPMWQQMIDLVLIKREPQWRKKLGALGVELAGIEGLDEELHRIRSLPPAQFTDAQWATLQDLLACMSLAATQLRYVFAARGSVDFCEVARQAVAALGEDTAPSDLALRLDYRIRHLLVDEFQDTSELQWLLLERLTAGWQPGDGRTLFLVGDPMQSIYRFREAEVGLFLRAQQHGIGAIRPTRLQLATNFRSHPKLVDWFNATFPRVLPREAEAALGAVPYTASVARAKPGDAQVEVHAAIGREAPQEAAEILELVAKLRVDDPRATIAILARSRAHLADIAAKLRKARVPYQAIEIERLQERPVVTELRALTRALVHPSDRIAWLAVLRSPFCGLKLADLRQIAQVEHVPILATLRNPALALSDDARARLTRVLPVIETAMGGRGRKPLRRWIEDAWVALGGPACVANEADLLDARNFFRVLERVARGPELTSLRELDEALAELRAAANPDAPAELQLMTIHKAKGLQFDHVIVPGLGRPTRGGDRPPLLWTTLPRAGGDIGFLMAAVGPTGGDKDAAYELVADIETAKERLEDGRLLYVAATRAKRQLHLFASLNLGKEGPSKPPSDSLLKRLWPAVEQQFAAIAPTPPPATQPASATAPQLRRLVTDWIAPAAPATPAFAMQPLALEDREQILFDWAGHVARRVGIVTHRWLQKVMEAPQRWDEARVAGLAPTIATELSHEGFDAQACNTACERVVSALRNTLADERGRWLLRDHAEARNELAIATLEAGVVREYRIDRTFVDESGTRWIVDYKTSTHEGGGLDAFLDSEVERYRGQLENYARLLRNLEQRPIRLGLYFPLLKAWRSWEFATAPARKKPEQSQLQLPL
ncbi:MAG TPA: UvrD-helicase domain-containing protein [Nevskiaceae bacterium]|nr:UvrD-helicase domain-containing protein [Nevskiaceae bacterium]